MVDPEEMKAGDEGVIVLVETVGGPLALKMTAAVAESIYHAIYERAKGN
jgi:hypothetical protein